MKPLTLALSATGLSVFLMAAAPGLQMIELDSQNHPAFPCSQKNKTLKRSQCVDFGGWGGIKGKVYVEDYIIHCKTGGTRGPDRKVTYESWNRMGRCK